MPFDNEKCRLAPHSLGDFDPAQLTACEVAYDALRDAGLDPHAIPPIRSGVYFGHTGGSTKAGDIVYSVYVKEMARLLHHVSGLSSLSAGERDEIAAGIVQEVRRRCDHRVATPAVNCSANNLAQGIAAAYRLDGPCVVVDAACASSLHALALGARALQQNEADMVVVGGASCCKSDSLVLFSAAQSVSEGKSCPFDENASGLVTAEGYVVLVLKTLARAMADGDRIRCVIRGIGMSADGRGKSLWAPRKEGQAIAMQRAYPASLKPEDIQYMEAHATSTQVGDATELSALAEAFPERLEGGRRIALGSVKANIGHTLETAGAAGLVKAALALERATIPPVANLQQPNTAVDWERLPFYLPRKPEAWERPADGSPRRAAVNSFGIGGLNVHILLEEYEPATASRLVAPSHVAAAARPREPIAVIGAGAILPKANGVDEYWQLLETGRDAKCDPPPDRWNPADWVDPSGEASYRVGHARGGFITDYAYDWRRHRVPPKQVANANPLQFMLLDATEQALEQAGYLKKGFDRDRVGVVVGTVFGGDFANQLQVGLRLPEFGKSLRSRLAGRGMGRAEIDGVVAEFEDRVLKRFPALLDETGSFTSSTLASRITRTFDFKGGALAMDAGHGSGLAAISAGIQVLRSGECDMVICATGQRNMDVFAFESLMRAGQLADGNCSHTYDGDADGIVPGEGCGAVLLKRLSDAERDGDRVLALLHSTGASADWRERGASVHRAVRRGLELAGVSPNDVRFVETLGGPRQITSTELQEIGRVLSSVPRSQPVCVNALVSQFGYLGAAHGMAGILKGILSFSRQRFPAGRIAANPAADLPFCPELQPQTSGVPLPSDADAVMGVSCGGMTGPAYFAVVEPAGRGAGRGGKRPAAQAARTDAGSACRIVRLAADDWPALIRLLQSAPATDLYGPDYAFGVADQVRLAIVCRDAAEFAGKCQEAASGLGSRDALTRDRLMGRGIYFGRPQPFSGGAAFVFPGQGSQYPGMLAQLIRELPEAELACRRADAAMRALGYAPFGQIAGPDAEDLGHDAWKTQISMLLADGILEDSLRQLGLTPCVVAGHSFGEYAALVCAGAWSLSDAIRATRHRYQSIQETVAGTGCMAATNAPAEEVERIQAAVGGEVFVGNLNAPDQTVISGRRPAVESAIERLKRAGHTAVIIKVPCPFHSPLMAPAADVFRERLQEIPLRDAHIPVVGTASARAMLSAAEIRQSLIDQLTQPVRYGDVLSAVLAVRPALVVEVGPRQTLTQLNRKNHPADDVVFLSSDVVRRTGAATLLGALAQADCLGCLEIQARRRRRADEPAARERGRLLVFDATEQRTARMRARAETAPAPRSPSALVSVPPSLPNGGARASKPAAGEPRSGSPTGPPPAAAAAAGALADVLDEPAWDETLAAAPPRPAPTVPPVTPVRPSREELRQILVEFVVEQTGYPEDIIETNADLEADLGIDSIKKAQLFGEVGERFRIAPREDLSLDDFPTLGHVLEFLHAELNGVRPEPDSMPAERTACEPAAAVAMTSDSRIAASLDGVPSGAEAVWFQILEGASGDLGGVHGSVLRAAIQRELAVLPDRRPKINGLPAPPWPEPCWDELSALAEKAEVNRAAVSAWNLLAEPMSALRTAFGDEPAGPLRPDQRYTTTLVQVRRPVSGLQYVTLGRPGRLAVPAGINACRLAISCEPLDGDPPAGDVIQVTGWLHRELSGSRCIEDARGHLDQLRLEGRWCIGVSSPWAGPNLYWVSEYGRGQAAEAAATPAQAAFHRMLDRDHETLVLTDRRSGVTERFALSDRLERPAEPAAVIAAPARPPAGPAPEASPAPAASPAAGGETQPAEIMHRHVLRMTALDRPAGAAAIYAAAMHVCLVGGAVAADVVRKHLKRLGCTVSTMAPESLADAFTEPAERRPAHLIVMEETDQANLDSFAAADRFDGLFHALRRWIEGLEQAERLAGASLAAITRMGGDFGFHSSRPDFCGGGITGLWKGIRREYPAVRCKVLGFPADAGAETIGCELVAELNSTAPDLEVGFRSGRRYVVQAVAEPAVVGAAREITRGGVWVVSCGGRGVTFAVARELARRYDLTLHLLGTAALPGDPIWRGKSEEQLRELRRELAIRARREQANPADAWRQVEKQIELDRNLTQLADEGVRATYHACDVGDRAQLETVLAEIRAQDGPIRGVLHGAGIEAACRLTRKRPESVRATIGSKCDGAANLIALTRQDPLEAFLGFGSTSGRFGGLGQADYSLASDLLAKMIGRLADERREFAAVCFHWPAWAEVGMAIRPESKLALQRGGITFMPVPEGVQHLLAELRTERPEREILILDKSDLLDADGTMRRATAPSDPEVFQAAVAEPVAPSAATAGDPGARAATSQTGFPIACSPMPLVRSLEGDPREGAYRAVVPLDAGRDPFLQHHRFRGKPFLPGVISLEVFAEAAALVRPGLTFAGVRDLQLINGWSFEPDRRAEATVVLRDTEQGVRCELRGPRWNSRGEVVERERLYASAVVEFAAEPPRLEPIDPGKPIMRWTPFFYPDDGAIRHGPPLRTFRQLDFLHGGGRAILSGGPWQELLGGRPSGAPLVAPAVLDGCLVACGTYSFFMVSQRVEIPQGIRRFRQTRLPRVAEVCTLRFFLREAKGRSNVYDFTLGQSKGTHLFSSPQMTFSAFVVQARQRLADLGWFMKCLKEPLASDLLFFVRPRACAENCREQGWLDNLLERLGTSAEVWQATLQKRFSRSRALGVAFTFQRERLPEAAGTSLWNVSGPRSGAGPRSSK